MREETTVFEKLDELKLSSSDKSLVLRQGENEIILPWQFFNEFITYVNAHNKKRGV